MTRIEYLKSIGDVEWLKTERERLELIIQVELTNEQFDQYIEVFIDSLSVEEYDVYIECLKNPAARRITLREKFSKEDIEEAMKIMRKVENYIGNLLNKTIKSIKFVGIQSPVLDHYL